MAINNEYFHATNSHPFSFVGFPLLLSADEQQLFYAFIRVVFGFDDNPFIRKHLFAYPQFKILAMPEMIDQVIVSLPAAGLGIGAIVKESEHHRIPQFVSRRV